MKSSVISEDFVKEFKKLALIYGKNPEDAKFQAQKINLFWEQLRDIPVRFLVAVAKSWPSESQYMITPAQWRTNALKVRDKERDEAAVVSVDEERRLHAEREGAFERDYHAYLKLPLVTRQKIEDVAKERYKLSDKISEDFKQMLETIQRRNIRGAIVEIYRESYK